MQPQQQEAARQQQLVSCWQQPLPALLPLVLLLLPLLLWTHLGQVSLAHLLK